MLTSADRPVIVYDADCGFCVRCVGVLNRWVGSGKLEYLPLQDGRAETLTGRCREDLMAAMHYVDSTGTVASGARALVAALESTWLGRLGATFMRFPGVGRVAEWLYDRIAANRYLLGCDGQNCVAHREENPDAD
ncbi:MAG: thiol-disulfide oxidoreductase DCC family protein [Gemmatimonadales bacterium]